MGGDGYVRSIERSTMTKHRIRISKEWTVVTAVVYRSLDVYDTRSKIGRYYRVGVRHTLSVLLIH